MVEDERGAGHDGMVPQPAAGGNAANVDSLCAAAEGRCMHDVIWFNARLATMAGDAGLGLIEDGVIAASGGVIAYAGPAAGLPSREAREEIDCGGRLITPGLIDCHTHLVFAGDRAHEFELRLKGASYEEIARAGGGIVSTVRATREASEDELVRQALPRLDALLAEGVTTIEIKSGYGLETTTEARQLRAARRLARERSVSVTTTFLGAHAMPAGATDKDAYIDAVCDEMLPAIAGEGLADAVDAFCEGIGFTPEQTERVFLAAKKHGLPVKLHGDQLSNLHGGKLAAAHGRCPSTMPSIPTRRVLPRWRGRARWPFAAGRLLFHPRDAKAACRGFPQAWRQDRTGNRLQPGLGAADLTAPHHEHGGDALPAYGGGVPAWCDSRGGAGAGATRHGRHAGARKALRPRDLERWAASRARLSHGFQPTLAAGASRGVRRMTGPVILTPRRVGIADIEAVLAGAPAVLDPAAMPRVEAAATIIAAAAGGEAAVYGVNTGFGKLASKRIRPEDTATLQRNLILSHCCGVGDLTPEPLVRLMMALKLVSLGRGASGVRPVIIRQIEAMLDRGVTPVVPAQGSVGASGDLAPLAHMTAAMIGEGEAFFGGTRMPGGAALAAAGLTLSRWDPRRVWR